MTIRYTQTAQKQLERLDRKTQIRIKEYLNKVSKLENPMQRGKSLLGNLAGYWRYRVGDYRIICKIYKHELVIAVVKIAHRKKVYKNK